MRLTYGIVNDYKANGKQEPLQTYLDEYMKKEDPTNEEFVVSPKLKELYKKADYGQYGEKQADGTIKMPICYITNNDITGGNSGSPSINAEGQLIGLAFDGNWEAMSGDIAYEPNIQRTIVADIRFILFVIDKYAGAENLIKELTLVK
jgi:V8-like Glu-specific endopeptidase